MFSTYLKYVEVSSKGNTDVIDITGQVNSIVQQSGITGGSVLIFVAGATGALSTVEYEPGLLKDLPILMEKLIPEKMKYYHNETWGDGNGHSHLRATLTGPSLMVPVNDQQMILGTWQQIVFIDFDNRPRNRRIVVQVSGE